MLSYANELGRRVKSAAHASISRGVASACGCAILVSWRSRFETLPPGPTLNVNRLRHLASSHRDLIIVTAALGLTTFTMGGMQPVLPLYAQSLGASVEQWGIIAAMWGVAMAIGEPFWGWIHDHVDRIAPLFFRVISGSLVFLAISLLPVLWPLALLNWWRGFSDAASWPTSRSLVSRSVSPSRMALAMGFLGTGARLGGALGAFVAGQVAYTYGYRPALLLSAFVSLSAGALILPRFGWPRLRRPRPASASPPPPTGPASSAQGKIGFTFQLYRPFFTLAGITVLFSVGWFGALTFLPFVVTSSLGRTVAELGILYNLSSIATAILTIPMAGLGDRVGRRRMVIGGLAIIALSLAGLAFARSLAQLAALLVLGALGQAAARPSMDALVSEASSSTARGRMMGLYGACEDMGAILGPMLGSLTWGLGGATATFLVSSCIAACGSVAAVLQIQDRRDPTITPYRTDTDTPCSACKSGADTAVSRADR
jgi:MFS family permease